jgi:predicted site-specific integrase-resolvase
MHSDKQTLEDKINREPFRGERLAYSPEELAEVLGVSITFLYNLWRAGQGPPYAKVRGRRIISRVSAERWLQEQTDTVDDARRRKEKRQQEDIERREAERKSAPRKKSA